MTTTNEQREAIIEKIRALQAKSQDHGVSEAEAVLFAEKAAELTAKYNLTFTEVEAKEEVYGRDTKDVRGEWTSNSSHPAAYAMIPIGQLYNCKPWGGRGKVTFFGAKPDTEQAHYLLQLCYNAIEFGVKQYKRTQDYKESVKRGVSPRSLLNSFRKGMASRLAGRIKELVAKNQTIIRQSGGTELVVVRDAALKDALRKDGIKLRQSRAAGARYRGAAQAGAAAGDRTSLSSGVGASGGPLQIDC